MSTYCCPRCKGRGRVTLTGVYAVTLSNLKKLKGREVNGAEFARLCLVKETAMNNRLKRLESLGFAIGRQDGRQILWRAA